MTTDRNHWAACSPAWLAAMPEGACSWAPRRAGDGRTVSHYHPAVPAPPPAGTDHRAQLLDALDFAYCQGLGYDSPEALLAAYDAACGVSVPPPADQTALRQRIADALAARFTADGDLSQGMRVIDPDDEDDPNPARWVRPGEAADVVMAVLPEQTDRAAEAERPLSPDYEHPECGFHWHGRDGMDIPIRDGQPVCPRCELRRAEKLLAHRERRCQELREECLRRGKNVLEQSLKIVALERQLDEVRSQLGAEILRAGQAETELLRVAAEEQPTETQDDGRAEARIRALHQQYRFAGDDTTDYCAHCNQISGGWIPWPCPTIAALDAERPAVGEQPETQETPNPRTVCTCGHTRGEHVTVSGRLLCDECDPDSTNNLVCKEFEAL